MDECNGSEYHHANEQQRKQVAEQILEMALLEIVREFRRSVLQATLQSLEPAADTQVPKRRSFHWS